MASCTCAVLTSNGGADELLHLHSQGVCGFVFCSCVLTDHLAYLCLSADDALQVSDCAPHLELNAQFFTSGHSCPVTTVWEVGGFQHPVITHMKW